MIAQAIFKSNGKIRNQVKTKLLLSETPKINSQNNSKFFEKVVVGAALAELKNSNYAKIGDISNSNEFKDLIELLKSPVYSSKQKKDLKNLNRAILEIDQPNLQEDFINVRDEIRKTLKEEFNYENFLINSNWNNKQIDLTFLISGIELGRSVSKYLENLQKATKK